jgi:flagellar hook-length control protein FliK
VATDLPAGFVLPATADADSTVAGGAAAPQLATDPSAVSGTASEATVPNAAQAAAVTDVAAQSPAVVTELDGAAQAALTVAKGSPTAPALAPTGKIDAVPQGDADGDALSAAAAKAVSVSTNANPATLTAADGGSEIQASAVPSMSRHVASQPLDTTPAATAQPSDKDSSASGDAANAFEASQASAAASAPTPMQQSAAPAPQTAPAAQPTPPQPSVPTQIAGLVAPLRTAADGNYTVSLQLHPAELGPVSVQVSVDQGVLSVQMYADHPQAHDALRASLSDLRGQLQAAGIQTGTVDVGVRIAAAQQSGQASSQGNSGFAGQQSWQQGHFGQQLHQGMHQQSGHGTHAEPQTGWTFDDAFAGADGKRLQETPRISGRRRAAFADDRAVDVRM